MTIFEIIEGMDSKHPNYGSATGIIAPDGKCHEVNPYDHLEKMKEIYSELYPDDNWLKDFIEETETGIAQISKDCEKYGEWHTLDFYESDQNVNLMTHLYKLGFFRFYIHRKNDAKRMGEINFFYTITIEGFEKNIQNIVGLIADLRAKFEENIKINIEKVKERRY